MTESLPPLPAAVEKAMQAIDMQGPVAELRAAIARMRQETWNEAVEACTDKLYQLVYHSAAEDLHVLKQKVTVKRKKHARPKIGKAKDMAKFLRETSPKRRKSK